VDFPQETIKAILDLSTRVDERVQSLISSNDNNSSKIEKLTEKVVDLSERLITLEAKSLSDLKGEMNQTRSLIDLLKEEQRVMSTKLSEIPARIIALESRDNRAEIESLKISLESLRQDQKEDAKRMIELGFHSDTNNGRWRIVGEFIFKMTILILGTILAFKLGVK
jgi:hypothetical protein